jgi:hypothetical protein
MIKVSINTTYHHTTAILHDTFFSIRKFISTCEVMLSVAVNSILRFFHHKHFSVLLRKGKDLICFYCFIHFYIFINVKHFFFTEHVVSL